APHVRYRQTRWQREAVVDRVHPTLLRRLEVADHRRARADVDRDIIQLHGAVTERGVTGVTRIGVREATVGLDAERQTHVAVHATEDRADLARGNRDRAR